LRIAVQAICKGYTDRERWAIPAVFALPHRTLFQVPYKQRTEFEGLRKTAEHKLDGASALS
jgi:hypothetical protein